MKPVIFVDNTNEHNLLITEMTDHVVKGWDSMTGEYSSWQMCDVSRSILNEKYSEEELAQMKQDMMLTKRIKFICSNKGFINVRVDASKNYRIVEIQPKGYWTSVVTLRQEHSFNYETSGEGRWEPCEITSSSGGYNNDLSSLDRIGEFVKALQTAQAISMILDEME